MLPITGSEINHSRVHLTTPLKWTREQLFGNLATYATKVHTAIRAEMSHRLQIWKSTICKITLCKKVELFKTLCTETLYYTFGLGENVFKGFTTVKIMNAC